MLVPSSAPMKRLRIVAWVSFGPPRSWAQGASSQEAISNVAVAVVGVLTAVDSDTARFNVQETKYGTLDGFQANGQVDVQFGREVRFLTIGSAYWVTARYNPDTGRIESKAKPDARLFGANEVLGVNDSSVQCPAVIDPFVTTQMDGTSIDTGVLTPFVNAKANAVERVLRSVALGLGALAFVVFAKRIVLWFIREGQYLVRRRRRARREARRSPPPSEVPAAP